MGKTIELQNKEIARLREMLEKIQHIESDTKDSQFCDIYK